MMDEYLCPIPDLYDRRELAAYRVAKRISISEFKKLEECRPDLKVHPLDPRRPDLHTHSGIFALLSLFYAISIAITVVYLPERRQATTTDDCGDTKSMSAMEKRFQIDIAAAEHLSFSRAKLIDLSWDIGVGQGGRLFHGWILYHVAAKTVTWILETSALPYSVLFDLLFYVDSLSALWSLLRLLGKSRGDRLAVLVTSLLLAFAIAEVLFFAAIWSAATGYQTPAITSYAMPDQDWVTKDSDDLRVCWKLESRRPELTGVIDGPILGPKYGTIFSSFAVWKEDPKTDYSQVSEDYANIQAYLRSRDAVRVVLERLAEHHRTNSITLVWNETAGFDSVANDSLHKTMIPKSYDTLESTNRSGLAENALLPMTIQGWQLLGVRQNLTASSEDIFWTDGNLSSTIPEDKRQQFIRSTFQLNNSTPHRPTITIPYNSTLWYRGLNIPLQAPFLGFMNCTWLQFHSYSDPSVSPPNCLCYKGEPISQDFRIDAHKACTGGAEYIWGFSHFLTRVGLILELVWCILCLYLWLFSIRHSNINQRGRSATGTLRNALDIAEVVKEELGDNIGLYTNKQLMDALSYSPPTGFATEERSDSIGHLGLVSVKDGGAVRRKIQLDLNKLYG